MRVGVFNALVVGSSLKASWHVTKVELKALRAPQDFRARGASGGSVVGRKEWRFACRIKI